MEPIKEVVFERTYNASRETVWQAWTNPDMIKQWWGPNNVLIPECEIDLRVGGKIYIVMEAGEAMGPYKGTKWPMLGTFTVVASNAKLSYTATAWTEGQKEKTTIDQTTELTLTEENGKTKLKLKATIHKIGPGAGMAVQGMQAGFTQQLDKLNVFLTPMNNEPIIIERLLNAPVDAVWDAMTKTEKMKHWCFDIKEFKPEVGCEFYFEGTTPKGTTYYHICKVTESVVNKKLAYSWRYKGIEGETLVTFELFKEGSKTRVRLTHAGFESFPKDNPDLARGNFIEGWTQIIGASLPKFLESSTVR